jgi:hypothetical protein
MDALAPPSGFPKNIWVIFLFIQAIANGQTFFIVFYGGKFGLAEIDSDVLHQMMIFLGPVIQQIRRGQGNQLPMEDICNQFRSKFQVPLMNLNGSLLEIHWICFLLGPRNIVVEMPEGEILAKYQSESKEKGISHITIETRNTREIFDVPTYQIKRFPTPDELTKSDEDFAARKKAEEAKAKAAEQAAFVEELKAKKGADDPLAQLSLTHYPTMQQISEATLMVLFLICKMTNTPIEWGNYQFILCVTRLVGFGDQSRFEHPLLSKEDITLFQDFKFNYATNFAGRVMSSTTRRVKVQLKPKSPGDPPLSLPNDPKIRLFEYWCMLMGVSPKDEDIFRDFLTRDANFFKTLARDMSKDPQEDPEMKSAMKSALTFPPLYWVQPEPGICTRITPSVMLPTFGRYMSVVTELSSED